MVFDTNGEAHGRSTEGLRWALDIDGVVDMTAGGLSPRQANNSQGKITPHKLSSLDKPLKNGQKR